MLKANVISDRLRKARALNPKDDPLAIIPEPDLDKLAVSGVASVDLRLGTWFVTLRHSRIPLLDVADPKTAATHESRLTHTHYVHFGNRFILHPQSFLLGSTLE